MSQNGYGDLKWRVVRRNPQGDRSGGEPLHRRWQWQQVAKTEGWPHLAGKARAAGKASSADHRRASADVTAARVATGAARARDRASSRTNSAACGDHRPPTSIAEDNQATSVAMCALSDPQSGPSGDASVTAWRPSSRQGRHQGCVDGELHAAPQRQAVGNDFNAPLVLPGGDTIEVTHQDMSGNSCPGLLFHTRTAARSRGPSRERNTPERGQAAT